jgi:hypothetical protein
MKISKVAVFVGDNAAQAALSQRSGLIVRNPPNTLIALADDDLNLHGELLAFYGDKAHDVEYVGYKTDADWRDFIRDRFPGQRIECARRVTNMSEYLVVVVFEEETTTSPEKQSGNQIAVEKFTYRKFWKVMSIIRACLWGFAALFMVGLGFFFVFPSGGRVYFGGLGWVLFFFAPIGAILCIFELKNAKTYSVELSEKMIRVSNQPVGWADIVKMETHMTPNDMATDNQDAILLTTRSGKSLSILAATENLPYIKKYIEDHALNLKKSDSSH